MSKLKLSLSPSKQGYLMIAPAMIAYLLFAVYPMVDVVHMSFSSWDGLEAHSTFVGLENYRAIFSSDPVFWTAFFNTIWWTLFAVTIPNLFSFVLALGLNQLIPGRSVIRALYYLPYIIAPIAVATIWKWMYDPFFGLFNQILTNLGRQNWIVDWLGDQNIALWSVFTAYSWEQIGFSMVLFLAGLQNVSKTLLEAGRIDGAGRWALFRYVTLPALKPSITIVFILSLINSLRAFDIVYGMTGGGPAQSTQMLAMWAYTQSMQLGNFGRGAAISVILLIFTIAIIVPYMKWMAKNSREVK
ncbi:carbohydrate ABC transporter permease [Vibrio salinus]|uniref:carbohydrate ABC transporter permease n=1 Tax=Vibrio salinus TaxID=2899784 RepID=UPI001E6144D3|nr:sugar ABC transporter permease [Vibrio salinus]MCE0492542.1 sugar ABC transporter permease [Vibrio salinus]